MRVIKRKNNYRSGRRAVRQPSLYSRTEETTTKQFSYRWLVVLALLFIFFGVLYLIFSSEITRVNKVVFSPTKYISREELEKTKSNNQTFFDNNIITFGFLGLNSKLEQVTGVSKISIERKGNREIYIKIHEEYPLLVWQTKDNKYLVNEEGIIWADYEEKYNNVSVVVDTKNLPVAIDTKVLPSTFIVFFNSMQKDFNQKTGATIAKIEVLDIISDIKVTTKAGWYVYFDTSRTANNQLISLIRVLSEVATKKQPLEYVDLRYQDKIFYK